VIGGEEDFFYAIRETAGKIPNARLVLYPNLGHNAMFVRSRQFGEEIRGFLLGCEITRPGTKNIKHRIRSDSR
jgi:pimeloyl-ACP methyl ester carboxylesterase